MWRRRIKLTLRLEDDPPSCYAAHEVKAHKDGVSEYEMLIRRLS